MKNRAIAVVAGLVSGSLLWGLLHAGGSDSPSPLKVGVVDLYKVVEGYQKKKDRETELNKVRDAAAAQLKALQKQVEGMSAELELLDRKSAEYAGKKRMLLEKQEELLMRSRLADREVSEKLEQYLQEVYSEILTKIEEFRAKNNFDFLLRIDTRPLTTQERIVFQLDRKIILANAKTFDVTEDVVNFLNQTYAK